MEGILTDISQPRWWFSTIFIAIVASLIAGFLKDAVGRWLSRTSSWYRTRKHETLARRERQVQVLCDHPTLLTTATVRVVIELILFVFVFSIFMFTPVWGDLMFASPFFASWVGMSRGLWVPVAKLTIVLNGVISFFLGARLSSQLALVTRAYRRLSDQLNGPASDPLSRGPAPKEPPNMALNPTVGRGRPPAG
jgi:hypothetical protein